MRQLRVKTVAIPLNFLAGQKGAHTIYYVKDPFIRADLGYTFLHLCITAEFDCNNVKV